MDYKIIFSDNSIWKGGHYTNSKWNEIPTDKAIKKIEYNIGFGKPTIILENYEAYNHLIEINFGMFKDGLKKGIARIMLLTKKGQDTTKIIYDFELGKIFLKEAEFGKEYYGKPTKGWKKGIEGLKPKTQII